MKSVVLDARRNFTLDAYRDVAWRGAGARFSDDAVRRMQSARASFMALLDCDPPPTIYGVTSGYGQMAKRVFTPAERKTHAAKKNHAPATAFGEPLPDRVTRGILFARLTNYVEGHAAITPELAVSVAAMLDLASPPRVDVLGNGGAGEIQPLAALFANLVDTFDLAEKDNLALLNGSPVATALLCDAALAAERRLALAYDVLGLSFEAIRAPMEHLDPALEDLWGDPHQARALRELRRRAEGGDATRRPYQAPVSWRILPRVLGMAERAVANAREIAEQSLSAVTDNPVTIPAEADEDIRVFSTGGYHNAAAAHALAGLAAAWADVALICERHSSKLLDGAISGLPDQLMGGDYMEADAVYHGCMAMAAVGFLEQARAGAGPNLLPAAEGGGFGANDIAPPTMLGWRKQGDVASALEGNLAILAVIARRALTVTDRTPPTGLKAFADWLDARGAALSPGGRPDRVAEGLAVAMRDRVFAA